MLVEFSLPLYYNIDIIRRGDKNNEIFNDCSNQKSKH